MTMAQAETGAIALYEATTQTISPKIVKGAFRETLCPAFSARETGECPLIKEKRTVLAYGARRSWAPTCRVLSREVTSVMCLPLKVDEHLVGAILLGQKRADKLWTTKHLSILSAMSARAALVVQNTQAYLSSMELMSRDREALALTEFHQLESPRKEPRPLLDISCFGRFQLYLEDKLLSPKVFHRRKSLIVLKILLIHRERPLVKEQLMEYLWPETNPKASARNLLVVMHDLRRGLTPPSSQGCPFILIERGNYHFNTQADYRLDVDEFLNGIKRGEALEAQGDEPRALATYRLTAQLYQGDFLEDENYNDWCFGERERLREIFLTLLEKIASLLMKERDFEGSAHYLQQILFVDNLRETGYRQLMYCLWRAGRSDEALRQYTKCQQILAQELGVEPLQVTKNLYLRIRKERGEETKSSRT